MGQTAGLARSLPATTSRQEVSSSVVPRDKHRADIQGLRAILMIQVLIYHAWFIGSPIGVDAFIMVSAYLMTRSFIRRTEIGMMPRILERWATTFKRLLPPLVVVVVATLLSALALLPATRWNGLVTQAWASITYWQNWLLASISTDYYAQDHALASPLQHLWSMSMQGQMFLLWPVLMVLCAQIAKRFHVSVRTVIFWGFAALTALSLGWLLFFAPSSGAIYFDTRARIWEFALGSAIAAIAPRLRLPKRPASFVSALALGVLVVYCLVSIGTYPGPMAAVPLLATSALLLYASQDAPRTAGALLAWRPLTWMGDNSYAVYLVHWPIFVLYLVAVDKERLGLWDGLGLIAVSVALAYLLTRFVDDPFRYGPWANRDTARKGLIIALTLAVGATAILGVQVALSKEAHQAQERLDAAEGEGVAQLATEQESSQTPSDAGEFAPPPEQEEPEPEPIPVLEGFPGAAAMLHKGEFAFTEQPLPSPLTLEDEWVMYPTKCGDRAKQLFYIYPRTGCSSVGDPATAKGRVLVAGSSHAEQVLMPAVRLFAEQNDLYVESVLRAGCPWSMPDPNSGAECSAHNANILQYAKEEHFDYIFLVVTATTTSSPNESLGYGVQELIEELTETGATVIGIRDNLRSGNNLFECASTQPPTEAYGGCLLARDDFYAPDSLVDPLLNLPGFHYIDIMDLYCRAEVCPTIIGNVQVYLDTNHITQTFGNTMAPIIVERVEEALGKQD